MGWETAATAAFSAIGASTKMNQGKAEAQAIADQGTNLETNIGNQTARTVGKLQTSFVQSGLALDGGPQAIIQQALDQGRTDIDRTRQNADNSAKNTYNTARTTALNSLISAGTKIVSGMGNNWADGLTEQGAYALNDMGYGNTAYNMLDDSRGKSLDPTPIGMPSWTKLGS